METVQVSFKASGYRREDFEHFIECLNAMGIETTATVSKSGATAEVTATVPKYKSDAKTSRTRRAGRRKEYYPLPPNSVFNSDTTCADFLEWLESHTAEEAMKELGLTRSTYFRRLKDIREQAEWERIHNPQRVKQGMNEIHHTIGGFY